VVWGGVGGSLSSLEAGKWEELIRIQEVDGVYAGTREEGWLGNVRQLVQVHGGLGAGWAFLRKGSEESSEWIFRLFGLFGVVGLE